MSVRKKLPLLGLMLVLLVSACVPQTPGASTPPAVTENPEETPAETAEATEPPAETAPAGESLLAGTGWTLVSIGETPVVAGSKVTLRFGEDGHAGGSAGCNQYGAPYVEGEGTLTFDTIISTLMACVDEDVMAQEIDYLAALQQVSAFTLDGDQLVLTGEDEAKRLVFTRGIEEAAEEPVDGTAEPVEETGEPTEETGASAPTSPAEIIDSEYLDDRSTPTGLIASYFNAVNRGEYLRAYSYLKNPEQSFDDFAAGYADTASVSIEFGQIGFGVGAGQMYWSVPVVLNVIKTDGSPERYAACYTLHLSNPAVQAVPPFQPMGINEGKARLASSGQPSEDLLVGLCESLDMPIGQPLDTAPVTDPKDISADNYLDERSSAVNLLASFFNAINRSEYARAYSYWREGALEQSFEQFAVGYENTASVRMETGEVTTDAGAGNYYTSVPVVLVAETRDGQTQTFAGCYVLHLGNPSAQARPPYRPIKIDAGALEQVDNSADHAQLLDAACRQ